MSTPSHFHSGSHSLALTINIGAFSSTNSRFIWIAAPLCASGGTVNLAGYTFSAWVYFNVLNGVLPNDGPNFITEYVDAPDGSVSDVSGAGALRVDQSTTNQWLHLQGNISLSDDFYLAEISVNFPLNDPTSEGFSGTMYLDDVQITPP